MFDSVNPAAIPSTAYRVALYGTGDFAVAENSPLWGRWHRTYAIDVNGTAPEFCSVADVENFDLSPADVPGWCARRLAAHPGGVLCRIYMNRSTWPAVKAEVAGMPADHRSQVRYWVADWTGVYHDIAGAAAVQYAPVGPYDLSSVTESWDS